MGPEAVTAQVFFETLFPDLNGHYLEIRRLPGGVQNFCTSAKGAAIVALSDQRRNVYFGASLRSEQEGDEDHAAVIGALWADIDFKDFEGGAQEAGRLLAAFEHRPSAVVDTGNGWHCYWLLREQEEVTRERRPYLRALLLGLAEALGGDRACRDLSRILRVPGTFNLKEPENPKPVQVIRWNPERRYNPSDFEPYRVEDEGTDKAPAAPVGDRIRDGQRNSTLTSLGGTMRRRGMSEEAIGAALLVENAARCDPSLPEAAVGEIARSVARYEPENRLFSPICNTEQTNNPDVPPVVLTPRPASALLREAPPVIWQVKDILPVGSAAVLVGDAGVGKSWLSLALAVAVDQGTPWFGQYATRQGGVLVVDEENADALLKRRLEKLLRGAGLPEDASTLNIEFLTAAGVNLSDDRYVAALEALLDEKRPALVLVDALVRVHRGNENDAGDMARVFSIIKRWIVTYGCSFVFCHHRRKPGLAGNDPANMFRGSSEIRAFVDCHLDLKPVKGETGLVTVGHAKSRYAEPVAAFDVEIVDTGVEKTVVRYAGETKSQVQEKAEGAKDFLTSLVEDGQKHARKDYLAKGAEAGHSKDTLDKARKVMVEAEELAAITEGRVLFIARKDCLLGRSIYKDQTNSPNASGEGEEADQWWAVPDTP